MEANAMDRTGGGAEATSAPTSEVTIQALTEEHLDGAREMANIFVGERKAMCLCLRYSWCPRGAKEFNAPYLKDKEDRMAATAIALKDGKVVGFVQMSTANTYRTDDEKMMHRVGPKEAYIEMAAVGPDARGHGVGAKLLQWCEALALERGCTTLTLGVVAG